MNPAKRQPEETKRTDGQNGADRGYHVGPTSSVPLGSPLSPASLSAVGRRGSGLLPDPSANRDSLRLLQKSSGHNYS